MIIFEAYEKISNYLKKKELEKIYGIGMLTLAVVMIVPLLLLAFVNVPNVTDDIAHTLAPHIAWMKDRSFHGFLTTVAAAWNRMREIYFSWGGNYTSFFFSSLQPIVFSEKLAFVGTFAFIGGLFWGEYQFLKETLCRQFGFSKHVMMISLGGIMILNTQYLTSARQAFYWYSGCVTNTLGFAASLLLMTVLLRTYRKKSMKTGKMVQGMLLAIFIGGCNYSSLMSLLIIVFLYGVCIAFDKQLQKKDKGRIVVVLATLFIASIISITAPGNAARQTLNDGSGALTAVINAIISGRELCVSYINVKVIIWTLILLPFIWNQTDEKKKYRLPLLLVVFSCGIFCAALTPTMKSDSNIGPRRTRNVYWWLFLNLYIVNIIYCIGWIKNKLCEKYKDKKWIMDNRHQVGLLMGIILLVLCTFTIEDIKKTPFTQATLDLVSGRAAEFHRQMQERYELYYNDDVDITVDYIEYIPQLFVEEDNNIYANEPGTTEDGEYYLKHSITVTEK